METLQKEKITATKFKLKWRNWRKGISIFWKTTTNLSYNQKFWKKKNDENYMREWMLERCYKKRCTLKFGLLRRNFFATSYTFSWQLSFQPRSRSNEIAAKIERNKKIKSLNWKLNPNFHSTGTEEILASLWLQNQDWDVPGLGPEYFLHI